MSSFDKKKMGVMVTIFFSPQGISGVKNVYVCEHTAMLAIVFPKRATMESMSLKADVTVSSKSLSVAVK